MAYSADKERRLKVAQWEPTAEQQKRMDAISARVHAGERGKSWEEVRKKIISTN